MRWVHDAIEAGIVTWGPHFKNYPCNFSRNTDIRVIQTLVEYVVVNLDRFQMIICVPDNTTRRRIEGVFLMCLPLRNIRPCCVYWGTTHSGIVYH